MIYEHYKIDWENGIIYRYSFDKLISKMKFTKDPNTGEILAFDEIIVDEDWKRCMEKMSEATNKESHKNKLTLWQRTMNIFKKKEQ